MLSGAVEVTLIDEDGQEVLFSEPQARRLLRLCFDAGGDLAPYDPRSRPRRAPAWRSDRNDISALLAAKPQAGLDMLTVLAGEIHSAQKVISGRAMRNPNELIDEQETFGERIADHVASFGGSWTFIISVRRGVGVVHAAEQPAPRQELGPYPYILLNLFLSMLAAIQAPVIMMSQNRQDARDRLRSELDFDVNRGPRRRFRRLSRKVHYLTEIVGDLHDRIHPNAPRRDDDPVG